ncbi:MAG: hypothetical protein HY369_03570 [Candidatus Aenigmarchaeota archaeon]|nr:hypothetical protein [Candidatus Aenigmarchaeota archaeon]
MSEKPSEKPAGYEIGQRLGSPWVYVGTTYEAPTFVNIETGQTKHIGTELTNGNVPRVYDGPPSPTGYGVGKLLQSVLRTLPDR